MAASIAQTVKDLIGDDMDATLVPSYEDLIAAGFNFVADVIPAKSELWSHNALAQHDVVTATTSVSAETADEKIILVTREHAGDIVRVVNEISYKDYLRGLGTTSIFYHGKASRDPVYSQTPDGDLVISPTPSAFSPETIYYFEYIDTAISTLTSSTLGTSTVGVGLGFPKQAFYAGCLKSAMNLLNARVSDAAQDDEDSELLQLIQAQSASLEKEFSSELQRLGVEYKIIGIRDDIQ